MKTITNIKELYDSPFDVIKEWSEGKIKSTHSFEIGDYTFNKERILYKGSRVVERIDEYIFIINTFKYWTVTRILENIYVCATLPDASVFKDKLKFFSWFIYNFSELNKYSFQGVSIRKEFINNNRVTVDRSYIKFNTNFCPKEYINKYDDVLSKFIKVDVEAKIYTGFTDYRYGEHILGYYRIGDILSEGANLFLSRREIQFYELKKWHIKNCRIRYKKYTLKESIIDYNDIYKKQDRENKVEEFKQYKNSSTSYKKI
ncbi:hypothetical protein DSECCO2_120630 [anaerobic digester metagenome]